MTVDPTPARPFMKFVGGKTQLLPELHKHVPSKFNRYYEPFVGGGAFFFSLASSRGQGGIEAYLSDINARLIVCYRGLRDDVEGAINILKQHARGYAKGGTDYYYVQRAKTPSTDWATAAWVIFLNKTCYNGLWRENKVGGFNVPAGKFKTPPTICDEVNLRAVSRTLKGTHIAAQDFSKYATPRRGDFWYADPPYWPASATADFTAYSKTPFGPAEQERLRDHALSLKRTGVKVLLSNADVLPIRKLYGKGFEIRRVEARRAVNSDATKRGNVGELLIW